MQTAGCEIGIAGNFSRSSGRQLPVHPALNAHIPTPSIVVYFNTSLIELPVFFHPFFVILIDNAA